MSDFNAEMVLPIEGLKYYIVHVESGKSVHPYGGSSNPSNNTPLVYHSDPGRLATQFIFENGQIKHYGSSKYIHPYGGKAGNNVKLVLYNGSDGSRTGIKMVNVNGKTYLKHDKGYYVHPFGGKDNPKNNTRLVYHSDLRPSLAVALVPAQDDVTMKSIEFDTSNLESSPSGTIVADTTVTNNSDRDQSIEATVKYERSTSNSFEFSFSEKIAFGMSSSTEVKAGLPGLGGVTQTFTFSLDMEFGATQTKSTSVTEGVENSITVKPNVEAGTTVKISVVTQRKSGDVPYIITFITSSGVEFKQRGTMRTEYFFDQKIVFDNLKTGKKIVKSKVSSKKMKSKL